MKEREIESAEAKLRRKQEEMEEMRAKYQAAQDHQEMIAERDTIRVSFLKNNKFYHTLGDEKRIQKHAKVIFECVRSTVRN